MPHKPPPLRSPLYSHFSHLDKDSTAPKHLPRRRKKPPAQRRSTVHRLCQQTTRWLHKGASWHGDARPISLASSRRVGLSGTEKDIVALLLSHTSLSRHCLMSSSMELSPTRNEVSLKQTHTGASHRGSLLAWTPQTTALHGVPWRTHALVRMMRTFSFFSCPKGDVYLRTHPTKD